MSYIGRGLDKISNIEKLDAITFDGSQSYSLTKSSVAFTPNSANSLIISINGVCQFGNVTVSGTSVDFGVAMPSTDTNDFILHLGVGVVNTPADATVTNAKLAQDIISGETELASEPADTDEFLVSDAGTLKRIDYSLIKASNTPAFFAHMGANQTVSNQTQTKLTIDTEIFDSDGTYDHSTNYRFTPGVAGYYIIGGYFRLDSATDDPYATITIYKNGSAYYKDVEGKFEVLTKHINQVVYLDADDYVELYAYQYQGSSITVNGGDPLDTVAGTFYGYKLIGI